MKYVFVHGLGQTNSSWDISALPNINTEDILCPNLYNLLGEKDINYENLYSSFADYCNNIPEKINICGVSLGGVLSLNYVADYPDKVNSLVLIGSQYKMPKTLLQFQNIVFKLMPKSSFKNIGLSKKDVIKLSSSMMSLDFSRNIKNISCDTMIICGKKDSANMKPAKYLAENIQNAKFHILDGIGHEVNIEAPKKLGMLLENFYII